MPSRCPLCKAALDYTPPHQMSSEDQLSGEGPEPSVQPCPSCGKTLVLGYYSVNALPECVKIEELADVRPYKLDEAIDKLLEERQPLPEPFAGFKDLQSLRGEFLSQTAGRRWCLFRHVHEPHFLDSVAGAPFLHFRMADWEAKSCRYADEIGLDSKGRLLWSSSRYMESFVHLEYRGVFPWRWWEWEKNRPVLREEVEFVGGRPSRIVAVDRRMGSTPMISSLRWKRDQIIESETLWGKTLLSRRKYEYEGGRITKVTVKQVHTLQRSSALWIGGWTRKESKTEKTDFTQALQILGQQWEDPKYVCHGKKGEVVGRFGAPLDGTKPLVCPGGNHAMTCLLHVEPVSVWWCEQCSYCHDREHEEGAFYIDQSSPKEPRIISKRKKAEDTYEKRPAPSAVDAVLAEPPAIESQCVHKLGGSPLWIQNNDWPKCVECGDVPEFWGQVGADEKLGYEFGDSGVVYVFWCPKCKVSAAVEQCF